MNHKDIKLCYAIIKKVKLMPILWKSFNFTYKSQKYKLIDMLKQILMILKQGYSWRFVSEIKTTINWNSIYKVFNKLNYYDIFKSTYIDTLKIYLKKGTNKKLQYISTDTSVCYNRYNNDKVGKNKYYKNKNASKLSIICDSNGHPLYLNMYKSNMNDSKILYEQLEEQPLIDLSYKKYFLADKGYDSTLLRNKLLDENYTPIIAYNKRNIKDVTKIKYLSKDHKEIYKKRIMVENVFCKLQNYKRLHKLYERKIKNYMGYLYLAFNLLLC